MLAPNLANPAQSHDAHFRSQSNAQATLRQLNAGIAAQLATFPIGSSSGGFTYTFDETLGVYNRTTQSFGPIFAERPLTLGKNKFALAVNYQHASWDRFEGRDLSGGELPLYLTHEDTNRDGGSLNLFFEGDIIKSDLAIDLKTDTTVLLASYGVSGRLDVGVAVPFLSIDMDANVTATIDNIATITTPGIIHQFDQNGAQSHVYRRADMRAASATCCSGPSGTSTAARPRAPRSAATCGCRPGTRPTCSARARRSSSSGA